MKRSLLLLVLAACGPAVRPWEQPWPKEPRTEVETVRRLPDGRYPIDLPTVLRLAGAHNLEVALVREKVRETYAREVLAWERFLPTVGPEYTFRRHEGLTQATMGEFVDVDKQQTFLGGRLRFRWEIGESLFASFAASQRYEGGLHAVEAAENSIALAAGLAYYELLREQLRVGVLEQSVEISSQLEKELQAAVDAGRGFRGDVLRASVQASSGRIALERARESAKLASIRLASILRFGPGIDLVAAEPDPRPLELVPIGTEEDWIREALASRPEIREALAEFRASEHELDGAAWGPLIPDLQTDVGVGSLGPVPSDLESSRDYVITLGWRIGQGGLFDFGRQDLLESKLRQAEIRSAIVRQRVVDEVRAARAQLEARARILEIARQEVRDAEEALQLNRERQAANIGLPLEVLQAEESLTRARLDLYTTVVDYNQAQLRIRAALGKR